MKLPIPRKTLNIIELQNGGFDPMGVVTEIGLNDKKINNYLIKSLDNQISFRFTQKNKKVSAGNRYLGAGGLTAVYSIELDLIDENLPDQYKNKLTQYKDKLILRIFSGSRVNKINNDVNFGEEDMSNDEQSRFMKIWSKDKEMFPENIIDLFLYGDLLLNDKYLGYYSITRVYGNENDVMNLNFINRMKYLKNMFQFIIKLKNNGLTYRDLKIANVGLDLDNYNFIVIDYDDVTLIKPSDVENLAKNEFLHYSVGTYAPIYFLENIRQNNLNMNYDLIYLFGLFDVVQYMFKKEDFKIEKYKNVVNAMFGFIKDFETLWEPIYNLVSCIYKNKTIPTKCEGFIKSIDMKYKQFIKDNIFSGLKKNTKYINNINEKDNVEYILLLLLSYIIYPLIVDSYSEASEYSQVENYTKIVKIIDIILEKTIYNEDEYKQKYLKYKQKYLKLKNL